MVEKLNEGLSEDDEMYDDKQLFNDPSVQNTTTNSLIKRQSSDVGKMIGMNLTPQKNYLHCLITSSEVMTNQIFEKVFMNDLPGLKKIADNFMTYYDKKKKFNLRDVYKRTALFYSLVH